MEGHKQGQVALTQAWVNGPCPCDPDSTTFFKAQPGNRILSTIDELRLGAGVYAGANYVPQAGSPALSGASFTDPLLSSWFEPTAYVGAFSTQDDWLRGWTEFDPQNADY